MATNELDSTNLRVRTARGTIINAAFRAGLAVLGLINRVAVAAFLTREEFGLWGIMLATLFTLFWLKQVGILDKYIQQREPDQELAFQKAFTLELALSCAYFVVCCLALPLFALAYGHYEIILPGIVLASAVVLTSFETPAWIPYRRMQFARERALMSVDPVVSIIAMVGLAAAGYGYWGLAVGSVIGSSAGAAVCVATSPYRLRIRYERGTTREYASFSWPLLGSGLSRLLVVQGSLLAASRALGLAAVAAIGLATSFATFADRVNAIVSQTIYPAVCRVADREEALLEVFVKSNRLSLMWSLPFGTGLALFAGDLVHFVLGDQWQSAVGLLTAFGVISGVAQLAFNWTVFMRALNRTRPLFVAALLNVAVFAVIVVPATVEFGLTGFAIGFGAASLVQIIARVYFLRSLFPRFDMARHTVRALAPAVPPVAIVLGVRAVTDSPESSLAWALGELAVFVVATLVSTYVFERRLISEMVGYLRGRSAPAPSRAAVASPRA
jgi:PST family polysaccharide transporter/lipopolysaccharide exporter